MPLYRMEEPAPSIEAPILVAALDGWVDAGSAGTLAAGRLTEDSRVVATFDGDQILDYRARRPTLDVVDGTLMDLEWPTLRILASRLDGHDLLVLTGPEPDYRWQELAADVVELTRRLGVVSWASLGAIPAAVPHTRPVRILGTASKPGLLPADVAQGPDGRLRVPSAALSVLELAVSRTGIPSVGFYAQVPHYVSAAYPAGAIELLGHLGRFLGVEIAVGGLASQALQARQLLDAATEADERTRAYVRRLEEMADEARLPAGDDLIADIERFLRERDGGDGRPN